MITRHLRLRSKEPLSHCDWAESDRSACGHAYPQARQRVAGKHQRKYALGVGPQRKVQESPPSRHLKPY